MILQYFYDQITLAPFIFLHDAEIADALPKRPELNHSTSSFFGTTKERKVDPYAMIAAVCRSVSLCMASTDGMFLQGLTGDFRLDIESAIPTRSPFSFTGTTSSFFVSLLLGYATVH